MCGQWGIMGSSWNLSKDELNESLSIEDYKNLIDELSGFAPTLTLFGGEPLLYRDWWKIVSYAKERGLRCNIITNCTLLDKKDNAERMVGLGVDEIILSLDGPREIHDEIRSAPGTFDKVYKGLMRINSLKGSDGPVLNINCALFEMNYMYLDEMIDVAEELQAGTITFHHLIFISKDVFDEHSRLFGELFKTSSPDWRGFVRDSLPKIDTEILLKKINTIKKNRHRTGVFFYPNYTEEEIREYYSSFYFQPKSYHNRCLSPWMVAYIFPDGSVRPCLSLNLSAGNIKVSSFSEIWNCDEYKSFRLDVKKRGGYPVCTRCTEYYRF